jgi:hypothetical protein
MKVKEDGMGNNEGGFRVTRLAVVNATHKGERLSIGGEAVGVEGRDGRGQAVIGHKPYNPGTGVPGYYTCSCPAWKFQGWRKKGLNAPVDCKHIRAMLAQQDGVTVENGGTIRKG